MSTTINRLAYRKLLDEDLYWLWAQPRTLERDHIEAILRTSLENEYELKPELEKRASKIAELTQELERLRGVDLANRAFLKWKAELNS